MSLKDSRSSYRNHAASDVGFARVVATPQNTWFADASGHTSRQTLLARYRNDAQLNAAASGKTSRHYSKGKDQSNGENSTCSWGLRLTVCVIRWAQWCSAIVSCSRRYDFSSAACFHRDQQDLWKDFNQLLRSSIQKHYVDWKPSCYRSRLSWWTCFAFELMSFFVLLTWTYATQASKTLVARCRAAIEKQKDQCI